MAGSNGSIFWLTGFDDIIDVFDDPAYTLQDELVPIPIGTSPGHFLAGRYSRDRQLPAWLEAKVLSELYGGYFEDFPPRRKWSAPIRRRVTPQIQFQNLSEMYPSVQVLRVKNQDDMDLERMDAWVQEAKKQLPSDLQEQDGVWYRGPGSVTLELNMNFFVPVVSNTSKNEFGPGIYVTPSLSYAKDIASRTGAIMVFKDIDERDLDLWEPDEEEWKNLVVHFLTLSRRNISIPVRSKEADIIYGPVSQQSWSVSAGELTQRAFVSYRSCERLASALRAIIFVENE